MLDRPWSTLGIIFLCLHPLISLVVSAHPITESVTPGRRAETSGSQDESNLPVQVGGIVGSYVIFDALVVFLLLFAGRRLRRAAQASNYTLDMVMLQPVAKLPPSTDPSPISGITSDTQFPSPDKPRGWKMSWTGSARGADGGHSSVNSSVATIDGGVLSADRRRAQEEMEYLYAAVMEHEAKKASAICSPIDENQAVPSVASPLGSPHLQSPRGFPPPQYQPPVSPRQETAPTKSRTSQRLSKISNLSIFNPSSRSSSSSNKLRSPHLSIRKLPISPPLGSPDMAHSASYEDHPPLTPRVYNPGPPPTAPLARTDSDSSFALQPINPPSRANAPAPLSLNDSSNSTLPFRHQFNPPQSAPPTRTTILERPAPGHGGPRTGMPTPYSPYMPFSPVTPMTPSRMVTKREKRRQDKSNGLRVLQEDDMVKTDEDIWGY